MKKKRALAASRMPDDYASNQNGPAYVIRDPVSEPNSILLMAGVNTEMLKITRDGFWVRGVRVEQDDKEAAIVYNAFKEWMTWAALTREYR
jgi:hypothetical protein